MASTKKVVKKVAKKSKAKSLFNPAEIELAGGSHGAGIRVTKASLFRDFLTNDPNATFGPSKTALAAALKVHGLELKDSDAVPFGVAKKKLQGGAGSVGNARGGDQKGNGVSMKQFAALTQNIDPATLVEAIKVIGHVGGIDNARALAKKWADLCDAIGEEAAKKAIEIL